MIPETNGSKFTNIIMFFLLRDGESLSGSSKRCLRIAFRHGVSCVRTAFPPFKDVLQFNT